MNNQNNENQNNNQNMMQCSCCGMMISKKANQCPNCGNPIHREPVKPNSAAEFFCLISLFIMFATKFIDNTIYGLFFIVNLFWLYYYDKKVKELKENDEDYSIFNRTKTALIVCLVLQIPLYITFTVS